MGNPSRQKIRIFDLEGLREVESKKFKFFMQKLKKQSISDTSKSKTYPFDDPNQRYFDNACRTECCWHILTAFKNYLGSLN